MTPADRLILLDLIGDARDLDPERIARLSLADWDDLARIAVQHRIEPLLHWQLERRHPALPIPDNIRAAWRAAFIASSRRQPMVQFELRALAQLTAAAGIPAVMLKGAFLAFHAYPDPALRPLRDIDVLVPDDRALDAYQLLCDAGARPDGDDRAVLAYALAVGEHHLPVLASPRGFVLIEVHRHIQGLAAVAANERDAKLVDDLRDHAVTIPLTGVAIAYPAPTDMLLHLIVHAAGNHAFDNGPLAIADLAFLLRRHAIAWPRFWESAERIGITRGAAVLIELAKRHWGPLAIGDDGCAPTFPGLTAAADQAALILLQDRDHSSDIWREHRVERGVGATLRRWRRTVFLPRVELAMIHDLAPDSPRIWARYPARWWSLVRGLLPRLRGRSHGEVRRQLDAHAALSRWLAGD